MKTLTVTIDVEPDASLKSWSTSDPLSFKGVFEGIPRIEKIAKSFNVPMTYFVQPVVLYDDSCVSYLKTLDGEFAAHLHGDYIGPEPRYAGPDFSGCDPKDMQKNYTPKVESAKMRNLTNLFRDVFGYAPLSFRAGRFGLSNRTFQYLSRLGYTHDSSVVPRHKHFKNIRSSIPYKEKGIIEVPVTVTKKNEWLRPTIGYSNTNSLVKILKKFYKSNFNVCCMFHNVEVIPRVNPYCSTEHDCSKVLDRFAKMLETSLLLKYRPITVSQVTI